MLSAFVSHLEDDHDLEFTKRKDGTHFIHRDEFCISFRVQSDGLQVAIGAPSESALLFFKDEVARHVEELDAEAASKMRWSGEASREGDLPPNFRILEVVKSQRIFQNMQRITLHMPDLAKRKEAGFHLKLMLPSRPGRKPLWPSMAANGAPIWPRGDDALHARYMTIMATRPSVEEIDIDVVCHGEGMISLWAQTARPGDEIGAMGPAGMSGLPVASRYLLVADMTGLSSVARILRCLPLDATGHVVVAAPDDCDISTYLPMTTLDIHRLLPDAFQAEALEMMEQITEGTQPEQAWFAGEFDGAQAARKLFRGKCGLGKGTQLAVAYWRRDHPGFSA
ncbi:siderophore-interacting protein [Pontivivens ytuae]|uniref:Siderophore-interacting protein n=1 Tax=Pontivivens ytuae TaxID=2789856 RepID=A0A7S9QDS6_9RHOB|nr:siderophore-interacting protein [Pontivivens ytuae]QPH55593.1 siderophore-interacting protein [Pontivivens ytuae]